MRKQIIASIAFTAVLAALTACSSPAEAAKLKNPGKTAIYMIVDDGYGPNLFGDGTDINLAARTAVDALRTLPRRRWSGDTQISFVSTVSAIDEITTPLSGLDSIDPDEFTQTFAIKKTCADFTDLFERIAFNLRRDNPDEAYVIMISPLYDVDASHCSTPAGKGKKQARQVSLPQAPKGEYALASIAANPAVKTITFIGWRPEQEQPYFEFIHANEHSGDAEDQPVVAKPKADVRFLTVDTIAKEIRGWR